MMKIVSIASFFLVISQLSVNWSQKAWELTGVQFSTSAILSSKLPSANYQVYDQIITDSMNNIVYGLNELPLPQKRFRLSRAILFNCPFLTKKKT